MTTEAGPAVAIDRERLSGPALRTFLRIADLWDLSVEEQMTLLGLTSRSSFLEWKNEPNAVLPMDTLERISHILGIYRALQILLPTARDADEWVKRPNSAPLFGGRPALDFMLSGQVSELLATREYLEAQLDGGA